MHISSNKMISALAAVALAAAIWAFAWNVLGISLNVDLRGQIASARAAWIKNSGGSYRAVVRVIDYNRAIPENVTVVVTDGKVKEAAARPAMLALDSSNPGTPVPADQAAIYTIEGLFDYASAQVADLPTLYVTGGNGYRYILTINPELSYIQEFKVDVCGRGPLSTNVSECRWGFDVLDVRIGT